MTGPVPVFEAVEWREPAPGGGSKAQVFRLADGRFAVVKFPENNQGERVLVNEFLSCQLAEIISLPVNRAVMISIDERLLRLPRQNNEIPTTFSAGLRCGMIRFENAESVQVQDVRQSCGNSTELHSVSTFEQLVGRGDGRQLLMYPGSEGNDKLFAAIDYGFAFGGQPNWSATTLSNVAPPTLPVNDPFENQPYQDGILLVPMIEKLRALSVEQITDALETIHPPRWGVTEQDISALIPFLKSRAEELVSQFDQRYNQQLEVL